MSVIVSGCVSMEKNSENTVMGKTSKTIKSPTSEMPTHKQILEALSDVRNYSFSELVLFPSINTTVFVRGAVAGKNASALVLSNTSLPSGVIKSRIVFFVSGNFYALLSKGKPILGCGNVSETGDVFSFEVHPWGYILNFSKNQDFKVEKRDKEYVLRYHLPNLTIVLNSKFVPQRATLELTLPSGGIVLKLRLFSVNKVYEVPVPEALRHFVPKVPSEVCGKR